MLSTLILLTVLASTLTLQFVLQHLNSTLELRANKASNASEEVTVYPIAFDTAEDYDFFLRRAMRFNTRW